MKRIFLAVFLCALCSPAFGYHLCDIPSPADGEITPRCQQKNSCLHAHPEAGRYTDEYNELLASHICTLRHLTNFTTYFGPPLDHEPTNRALPCFAPSGMVLYTARPGNVPDKSHVEFFQIGNFAYLQVYFRYDGVTRDASVIFFRTDDNFIPLHSITNFPARLEWDKAKFVALKTWIEQHLPKITDLGLVDVSSQTPTRIQLDPGVACSIRVHGTNLDENPTTYPFWLTLSKDTQDRQQRIDSHRGKFLTRPDEPFYFSIDNKIYRLTPKLTQKTDSSN